MAEYIRMVSYLNIYRDGEKKQNCGFAKIDSRNGICRVYVNIQMPFIREKTECSIYFFLREGENLYGIFVGTANIENGRGFAGISMVSSDIGNSGYSISEMSGMYIKMDEDGLIIASEWDDIPIQIGNIRDISEKREQITDNAAKTEQVEPDYGEDIPDTGFIQEEYIPKEVSDDVTERQDIASGEENIETESLDNDESSHREFWNSLGRRCVKMTAVDGFEECIRMKPNDIVCFPKRYWSLGQNSFLLHGYYNYRYLMAARYIEDGVEKYVIGVPGEYHNNEKIMASMFGFGIFTGKEDEGEKGYWCMNLE